MIRLRPVKPRASRTAVMVASVPVDTIRRRSTAGTRSWTMAARLASSGVEAPKESPRSTAAWTASSTAGWAWPSRAGPQEQTRSTYSLPSASVRYGPFAETMKRGVPPTEPKARTGELTPPGISRRARSKSASLRGLLEVMVSILSVSREAQSAGEQFRHPGRHRRAHQFDGAHHGAVRQRTVAVFQVEAVNTQVPLQPDDFLGHRFR